MVTKRSFPRPFAEFCILQQLAFGDSSHSHPGDHAYHLYPRPTQVDLSHIGREIWRRFYVSSFQFRGERVQLFAGQQEGRPNLIFPSAFRSSSFFSRFSYGRAGRHARISSVDDDQTEVDVQNPVYVAQCDTNRIAISNRAVQRSSLTRNLISSIQASKNVLHDNHLLRTGQCTHPVWLTYQKADRYRKTP